MDFIVALIKSFDVYIIMGLSVLTLIMLIIMIINSSRISKLSRKYRKFMRGTKDKNIEELLESMLEKVDKAVEKCDDVKSLYSGIDKRLNGCTQKVSIIRYKAFDKMGSALSFSIAFLDAYNDGVIITGIYGSDECTTYAKPIDKGVPKYDLSEEEEQVLQDAMKKKIA
jgi:hypothetical protein